MTLVALAESRKLAGRFERLVESFVAGLADMPAKA